MILETLVLYFSNLVGGCKLQTNTPNSCYTCVLASAVVGFKINMCRYKWLCFKNAHLAWHVWFSVKA